jgi:hypothetical protein
MTFNQDVPHITRGDDPYHPSDDPHHLFCRECGDDLGHCSHKIASGEGEEYDEYYDISLAKINDNNRKNSEFKAA